MINFSAKVITRSLLFAIAFKSKRATTITVVIVGRVKTIRRAIQKKNYEPMYKMDTKNYEKAVKSDIFCFRKVAIMISI